MVYIWRNTIRKVLNHYLITVSYATVIEKWQRDCRPTEPPYSSRHPAPIEPGTPLSRCAWPLLIRSLATAASLNEGFPEIRHRCLRVALPVAIACQLFYRFHTMSEKPPKQMKVFGRKLLSRRRHFSLSRVAIGKRHKKWHITAASDNVRFRRDAKISKSELRQLRRRTPAGDRCKSYV